jgi:hypothetical protein
MNQLNGKEIRILTKNDLYTNYPFPYYFALILTQTFPTALASKSLKELLFLVCLLSYDENMNELFCQDEFFNQHYDTFFCMNAYFVVKNGILYYLDSKSKNYFNLENLNYSDILISSIMYLVIQNQKECKFIPWLSIHEFLLQLKSSDTKLLCFFLKEILCMKNERIGCIKSLICILRKNINKKKYSKQNILAILDLIGIDFNKANSISKNYISIFNKPSVLINFLEKEIK